MSGAGAVADPVARRTVLLQVIATGTWALYTVIDGVLGHRLGLRVNGVAAIGTAALAVWAWRRPDQVRLGAHAAAALSVAGIVGVALLTGHTRSPVIWFLSVIPLFMGYLRGTRATVAWAVVCGAGVGLVEVWRIRSPIQPEYIVEGPDLAGRIASLIGVVAAFALAARRLHEQQLRELERSKDVIRELLDQARGRAHDLATARDAALDASRAKGDFLAVMSHEIRTPLNAVLGFAGVLLDAPLPPEQREIVRMIRQSGDTLLSLLNDVLDFSKIEAGRMTLEQAPFDVAGCVEDAVDLSSAMAAAKDIDLSCHVATGVPARVEGDATRVRQILVNLVSNAVKFTPHGSVEVRVTAAPIPGEEALSIRCSVRDTGIGIPADRVEALFDEFSQADASTTRRFGGTGLGLAICRALAERMGGRVWAENNEDRGSTFHFTFRASPVVHAEEPSPLREQGVTAVVLASRDGTRAAVVAQLQADGVAILYCGGPDEVAGALQGAEAGVVVADEAAATDELRRALDALEPCPAVVLLASPGRDAEARRALRRRWPEAAIVPIPPRRSVLREALVRLLTGEQPASSRRCTAPSLAPDPKLRVLVVEDNPVNQKVMALLLERLGVLCDMAGNGVEALHAVHERPYDLVLMDMRMPEMDGPEAARRIRAELPAERQPRIVALTANVTTEDRELCQAAGMDDFLGKPVTVADLGRVIAALPPRVEPGVQPR